MFDGRTNLSQAVVERNACFFGPAMYDTIIPRNVRLAEAPASESLSSTTILSAGS